MTDGPPTDEAEVALAGGMGSGGQVVRVGSTVRRPFREHTPSVHAFLDHLERVGFTGAPRALGRDELGREVLSWMEGDVGVPPFPDWVADEELLVSVAVLEAAMHEAARSFVPPDAAVWDTVNLAPPKPGALVCHNDLCVENAVVDDGVAVAFIDFDFTAPSDRLVDIAITARHWIPVRDSRDIDDARRELDPVARWRHFMDAHGLDADERQAVAAHLGDYLDRALVSMELRAASGNELYRQVWEQGYEHQNRRSRAWLARHASELCRCA
ncbi:MAG: phosphotransferase [Acidimicrobiia bacterium]